MTTDFLTSLAARSLGLEPSIRPRLASPFEPVVATPSLLSDRDREAMPSQTMESARPNDTATVARRIIAADPSGDSSNARRERTRGIDGSPAVEVERTSRAGQPSTRAMVAELASDGTPNTARAPRPMASEGAIQRPMPVAADLASITAVSAPDERPNRVAARALLADARTSLVSPSDASHDDAPPRAPTTDTRQPRTPAKDMVAVAPTTHQPIVRSATPVTHRVDARSQSSAAAPMVVSPRVSRHQPPLPAAEPQGAPPEPVVRVTIGRIEVRAVPATSPPRRRRTAPTAMSLEQYLTQRSERRR